MNQIGEIMLQIVRNNFEIKGIEALTKHVALLPHLEGLASVDLGLANSAATENREKIESEVLLMDENAGEVGSFITYALRGGNLVGFVHVTEGSQHSNMMQQLPLEGSFEPYESLPARMSIGDSDSTLPRVPIVEIIIPTQTDIEIETNYSAVEYEEQIATRVDEAIRDSFTVDPSKVFENALFVARRQSEKLT